MKCPYCQKEMIKGYLQSRDRLGWNENERLIAAFSGIKAGQSLDYSVVAYNCKSCKKLIIDYADDQTEA